MQEGRHNDIVYLPFAISIYYLFIIIFIYVIIFIYYYYLFIYYHPGLKYAHTYYSYLKKFAVKFRENAILTFLGDKATAPLEEPLHAVSTNVRTHNRSLGVENVV